MAFLRDETKKRGIQMNPYPAAMTNSVAGTAAKSVFRFPRRGIHNIRHAAGT